MKVEIRDITKEEAVPYGDNADCIRPNVTFRNGTQTETVLYDDWNGTAAYNSTFNPNFKKGE